MGEQHTNIPGPNEDAVTRIISECGHLTRRQILDLAAAGYASWNGHPIEETDDAPWTAERSDWDDAWDAARNAALSAGWGEALDAILMDALRAVAKAAGDGFSSSRTELAGAAAGNAACAALVQHLITDAQYEFLTSPWLQVAGS